MSLVVKNSPYSDTPRSFVVSSRSAETWGVLERAINIGVSTPSHDIVDPCKVAGRSTAAQKHPTHFPFTSCKFRS